MLGAKWCRGPLSGGFGTHSNDLVNNSFLPSTVPPLPLTEEILQVKTDFRMNIRSQLHTRKNFLDFGDAHACEQRTKISTNGKGKNNNLLHWEHRGKCKQTTKKPYRINDFIIFWPDIYNKKNVFLSVLFLVFSYAFT